MKQVLGWALVVLAVLAVIWMISDVIGTLW